MPKEIKDNSLKLIRHLLGSIDLSDIEAKQDRKDMSEADRKAYCAAIFAVWPRLEKDIKEFLYDQLMFSSNEAETWERVIFGRGSFNGMDLLFEHWKKAVSEHQVPEEGEFNKNNPISEI